MTLSKNTPMTLGLVALFLGPLIAAVIFGMRVDGSVDALQMEFTLWKNNQYSLTSASEDALRMAVENPGMRVPDPRHPGSVIVVEVGRIKSSASSVPPGGFPSGMLSVLEDRIQ